MAENQSSSSQRANLFFAGMNSDLDPSFIQDGQWSYARNASKVTASGSLQTLSTEASNVLCTLVPYDIIGIIHLYEDKWAVFTTDDTHSEIGWFDDSDCSYTPIVNDVGVPMNPTNCLNFNRKHLIIGISKQNFDCTYQVYFADGNNPDRTVNMNKPQFNQTCTGTVCITCVDTDLISCPLTLLASLVDSPCVTVNKSRTGGTLLNGSYFATVAYTINDQVVTDYFPPSNVQPLFDHSNLAGSLDITFSGLDVDHFTEFQLVIVRTINQQVSAKKIGIYSTQTKEIFIDNINEALPTIPIEQIPIRNPVFEKSDAICAVGDYAIRVAPVTKFDFNYQPLANRITAKWQSVEYPSDYYRKGGNNPSYLRDEIYSFFIRWVYTTGDRSSSYHIPGRAFIQGRDDLAIPISDVINPGEQYWEVVNTASVISYPNTPLSDGGIIIAQGDMGYWQSTEEYPDHSPEIWNSSFYPWSNLPGGQDLCGLPIRHHKMPDNLTPGSSSQAPNICAHFNTYPSTWSDPAKANQTFIRILGVVFENIRPPVDNNGDPIPDIAGYEILRGSREGNKTVIAKGMINNMRGYTINDGGLNPRPGLYQNYPYNYQGADMTLRTQESVGNFGTFTQPGADLSIVYNNTFTFHSPDTQFKHPFLSTNELKRYGTLQASIVGNFESMPYHPREKLMGDLGFFVAAFVGVAEAVLAIRGQRVLHKASQSTNVISLHQQDYLVSLAGAGSSGSWTVPLLEAPFNDIDGSNAKNLVNQALINAYVANNGGPTSANIVSILSGAGDLKDTDVNTAFSTGDQTYAVNAAQSNFQITESPYTRTTTFWSTIPGASVIGGTIVASHYWMLGTDTALRLIEAIIPYEQYAYRYISHGYYNVISGLFTNTGSRRFKIVKEEYLGNGRQQYGVFEVNNLYRSEAVILSTATPLPLITQFSGPDESVTTIGISGKNNITNSYSEYVALIQRFRNQYGQLDSIQQLPVSCKYILNGTDSYTGTIFGGDTYITRYTEKNTFFYFYDWLMDQPNGYEFDYRTRYMLTYPRYWADFTKYEAGDFISDTLTGILSGSLTGGLPTAKAALDDPVGGNNILGFLFSIIQFRVKPGYFYISNSGVRDFFVESEVNTELRDWDDLPEKRFFDPYQYAALEPIFDPKILKVGNYFKYDYSLSISKLFINFISWGNLQPRYYDPLVAQSCYVRRPNRLIYSLPQNLENTKDYWRVYLANNYKDFVSDVSVIKPTAKNGAIILFKSDSPLLFQGVDQLQTDLGTKVTLGDGGLFSQTQQSIVNVDVSYEYGSCQDRLSVVNTPFGLFYMCTNQGKIFQATNTLRDITYDGLKFWFKEYLPMRLLLDFPTFDILDNPLAGIGCQAVYDNQIETLYFSKRDYQLKADLPGTVTYSGNGMFSYISFGVELSLPLGDPLIFDDASFTVSYDPKTQKGGWISYHDWHPHLNIPSRNNFLSTQGRGIWRHNKTTQSFCNYYGIQYPFAVEYIQSTPNVNTLRSIEYYLECYKYTNGTLDRYNLLEYNFDHAIIHNLDQTSGVINLKQTPKNDPWGELAYPKLNLIPEWEVLYSKEESKYRFNDFWDITRDRGEFAPFAKQTIWITEPNGYIRTLNQNNLNYNKEQTQRKKFRGYLGKCLLYKKNPEFLMSIKAVQSKLLVSAR